MRAPARGASSPLEAVVLSRQDHGEADRILRLLSAERGRSAGIARAARRAHSRFGAALEPTQHVRLSLRLRPGGLDVIEEAELIDAHLRTRDDLDRLALAAYATELCGGLAREDHPEPKLYGLLQTGLLLIDAASAPPGVAFRLGLEAKALTFAGLLAPLDRCAACGHALEGEVPWSIHPHSGAAGHPACLPGALGCSAAFAADLERARRSPLQASLDADPPAGPTWALSGVVEAQLGRPLRAKGLLRSAASFSPEGESAPDGSSNVPISAHPPGQASGPG